MNLFLLWFKSKKKMVEELTAVRKEMKEKESLYLFDRVNFERVKDLFHQQEMDTIRKFNEAMEGKNITIEKLRKEVQELSDLIIELTGIERG